VKNMRKDFCEKMLPPCSTGFNKFLELNDLMVEYALRPYDSYFILKPQPGKTI